MAICPYMSVSTAVPAGVQSSYIWLMSDGTYSDAMSKKGLGYLSAPARVMPLYPEYDRGTFCAAIAAP